MATPRPINSKMLDENFSTAAQKRVTMAVSMKQQ
jgi:hypothetical protein